MLSLTPSKTSSLPCSSNNYPATYHLIFESTLPTSMCYLDYDHNPTHLGSNEPLNYRIYTQGCKPNMLRFKLQLDSHHDPFFLLTLEYAINGFRIDQNMFSIIKNDQQLSFEFQQLATILIKCFNRVPNDFKEIKSNTNTNTILARVVVESNGKSKLSINHVSEFKNVQVIALELQQDHDQKIEQRVRDNYQAVKRQMEVAQKRLARIGEVIKEKNPSLLAQIRKVSKNNDCGNKSIINITRVVKRQSKDKSQQKLIKANKQKVIS